MKVRTKAYISDTKEYAVECFEKACADAGVIPNPEAWRKARWAFNEFTLTVEFDSETGECRLVGAKV